jgi:hypothetical protein
VLAVVIVVSSSRLANHYAPYGGWEKVAEGTVSADGVTITTHDSEGIELLSIYGLVLQ